MQRKRTLLTSVFVILAPLSVNSCLIAATECSWVKQISTSRQDTLTRQTENEIIAHNEKVLAFCR